MTPRNTRRSLIAVFAIFGVAAFIPERPDETRTARAAVTEAREAKEPAHLLSDRHPSEELDELLKNPEPFTY